MEANTAGEALVTIEFDAKAVAPLAMFMAKEDIRYYITGFCVMPSPVGSGVVIAATDGHRLALWHDEQGVCTKQTILKISPPLVTACKKRCKIGGRRTVKFLDGRLVVFDFDGGEAFIQAGKAEIEGKYPDIWRVIPEQRKLVPGLHGLMNGNYLKDLGAVARLLIGHSNYSSEGAPNHYSDGNSGDCSILTRFECVDNFIVITMPLRGRGAWPLKRPLPDKFIKPEPATQPATASYPVGSMGDEVPA